MALAMAEWISRPILPEEPEQQGISVEFVINALPSPAAEPPSQRNLPSSDRENERQAEEPTSARVPAEKNLATAKHQEIRRPTGNPEAAARGEATPAPLGNPRPEYPDFARRKAWQGECLLRVVVSPEGRADTVRVHRSSGYAILDHAATAAVKRWTFLPRVVGGQRLISTIEVPVNFSLRDR